MNRADSVAVGICVATLAGATPVASQSTVVGQVMDDWGEPLIGASVEVGGLGIQTTSDSTGAFTLEGLPTGSWPVRARLTGWRAGFLEARVVPGRRPPDVIFRRLPDVGVVPICDIAPRALVVTVTDSISGVAVGEPLEVAAMNPRARFEPLVRPIGNDPSVFVVIGVHGPYRVQVSADGYRTWTTDVLVEDSGGCTGPRTQSVAARLVRASSGR
jgi:hypothetical protein